MSVILHTSSFLILLRREQDGCSIVLRLFEAVTGHGFGLMIFYEDFLLWFVENRSEGSRVTYWAAVRNCHKHLLFLYKLFEIDNGLCFILFNGLW